MDLMDTLLYVVLWHLRRPFDEDIVAATSSLVTDKSVWSAFDGAPAFHAEVHSCTISTRDLAPRCKLDMLHQRHGLDTLLR